MTITASAAGVRAAVTRQCFVGRLLSEGGQTLSSHTKQVVRRDAKKGFLGPGRPRAELSPTSTTHSITYPCHVVSEANFSITIFRTLFIV